jgi:hypothetical protein
MAVHMDNLIGNTIRRGLIGGRYFPNSVERVLSGEMQGRTAHAKNKKGEDLLIQPEYSYGNILRTTDAIRGAFTLRLIGRDGMSTEQLEERNESDEAVPNLELLDNKPISYKLLGVDLGANFLKITGLIDVANGTIKPSERATEMLDRHPYQPYTVLPAEMHTMTYKGIDTEYTHLPLDQTHTEIAETVYQQYTPHYQPL